jgi:DHA1 family bicyclomycin/chloramphenicol resistance-like MFS transporter
MAYTLGPMLAPPLGGVLIDHFGWRSTFWFALSVGVAILFAAWAVLYETHHARNRSARAADLMRTYIALVAQPRFTAFVMQSGFSTATFMAMATAASFLMQDYLGRSAREFGLYFVLFPGGLFLGNLVASRLSGRIAIETMVLAGSVLCVIAIAVQAALILGGVLTPLVIFLPGILLTFAQGLAYPNAQSGAMRVMPSAAGTAAGLSVFFQMMLAALGAQTYALLADGTPHPMVTTVVIGALLTLAAGIVPFALKRRAR